MIKKQSQNLRRTRSIASIAPSYLILF